MFKIKTMDLIEDNGSKWVAVDFEGMTEPLTLTLNEDRTIFLENFEGGSALQDSERDFKYFFEDSRFFNDVIKAVNSFLMSVEA